MATENNRRYLKTVLKIVISTALIYFIFTKINFSDVKTALAKADFFWLLLALLLFVCSKVLNSLRLNLYFGAIGVKITQLSNLKLYFLGMFYNLFLPGGIGGDAYKGYILQKRFAPGIKKVVGVLLLDRLSGMLLILIYALVCGALLKLPWLQDYQWLLWLAIPVGVACFWFMNKIWFSYGLLVFWRTFWFSAALQAAQVLATFAIIIALGVDTAFALPYLFIFMVSSVVSVLPLTIGGIGSREITFLYGAKWLGLEVSTAIAISFIFFLMTALVSFLGIVYHFKKPVLVEID